MAVFYGERNNCRFGIGGTDTYKVERGKIVNFANNEVSGIRAFCANVEIIFIHRDNLTPHSPIINAMTSDGSHGNKVGDYSGAMQEKQH